MATGTQVGFAIWVLRQSRQMTQRQLAARMSTSRQQVGDLEVGQSPTIDTLLRLARALRVPPALLIQIAEARRSELAAPPNSV